MFHVNPALTHWIVSPFVTGKTWSNQLSLSGARLADSTTLGGGAKFDRASEPNDLCALEDTITLHPALTEFLQTMGSWANREVLRSVWVKSMQPGETHKGALVASGAHWWAGSNASSAFLDTVLSPAYWSDHNRSEVSPKFIQIDLKVW